MPVKSRIEMYRAKALAAERRSKQASDQIFRQEWEELAIEWHAIANFAAKEIGKTESEGSRKTLSS
jgi:hypothetical protein